MSKSVKVLAHFLLASCPLLAQKVSIVTRAVVFTNMFIGKYDQCCIFFIKEIIHPYVGTYLNTLPKKRDIEGVFGRIFIT